MLYMIQLWPFVVAQWGDVSFGDWGASTTVMIQVLGQWSSDSFHCSFDGMAG